MPRKELKTPVYLDNNATTPIDHRVQKVMIEAFKHFGNPSSSTHTFGWYAEELVQIAREQVAALIHADPTEIYFTSGATESNNLALKGHALKNGVKETRCISVSSEHKAILDPLQTLSEHGLAVDLLGIGSDGLIHSPDLAALISDEKEKAILLSVMLANNEIGVVQNLVELRTQTANRQLFFHSDATQAVGKIKVDTGLLPVDALSFSAHKIYGPKGIGALYLRKSAPRFSQLVSIEGGGHELGVRSGTLNVPAIVGFGEACRIAFEEFEKDKQHITALTQQLKTRLREQVKTCRLNGSESDRIPGNLNICFPGIDSTQLIGRISTKVACSLSSACQSQSSTPSHVLSALGLSEADQRSSIRFGIGRFNTLEEIAFATDTIVKAIRQLSQ